MTASAGVAINTGVPTVPLIRSSAPATPADSPSFHSELQSQCSPENTANAAPPLSPKRAGKNGPAGDKKAAKNDQATNVATPLAAPVLAAQNSPAPPLALTLTVCSDPQPQPTDRDDPDADKKDQATAPASTLGTAAPDTQRPDFRLLPLTLALPDPSQDAAALAAATKPATPTGADVPAATAATSSVVPAATFLAEELPQFSSNTVEDAPAKPGSQPGEVAFAARLTPSQPDANSPAAPAAALRPAVGPAATSHASSQASVPQKYLPGGSVTEDPGQQDGKEVQVAPAEQAFKVNPAILPVGPAIDSAPPSKTSAPEPPPQAAAEALQDVAPEPARSPATSSHDFQVRIPDNQGGAMNVRFVESGGDVRVTVKTPDATLAQTLRSQLNQLTQQLSTGGIQTELWQPGSDSRFSQGSHQESQNFGQGSGSGRKEQGQQQESNQNRPRWLEEMELSGGLAK